MTDKQSVSKVKNLCFAKGKKEGLSWYNSFSANLPTVDHPFMTNSTTCYTIFEQSVKDYHLTNDVDQVIKNPYPENTFHHLLYLKNWIDTIQWHLEDIVRDPAIEPVKGLEIKRKIDKSNQYRTDVVEKIDDYFVLHFSGIKPLPGAKLNSETPAWLLDRMSILVLKIFHMEEQTRRTGAAEDHLEKCRNRLTTLFEQREDMGTCFDELLKDVQTGIRRIKVYRQMKMYNDADLNPVLYSNRKSPT